MDDQQRARELLAQEYERLGEFACAAMTRSGRHEHRAALAAITAALRAAPEAVALRTAMTTLEQIASASDDQGAKFNAMGALRFLQTQPVELRAAPEGFVLVPVDLRTRAGYEMWEAGIRVRNMGGSVEEMWAAMLAARPQGVKDAT